MISIDWRICRWANVQSSAMHSRHAHGHRQISTSPARQHRNNASHRQQLSRHDKISLSRIEPSAPKSPRDALTLATGQFSSAAIIDIYADIEKLHAIRGRSPPIIVSADDDIDGFHLADSGRRAEFYGLAHRDMQLEAAIGGIAARLICAMTAAYTKLSP